MAFKVLNSEELSLLNDSQKKQYEKELNLYQQRVAFVEHFEMLENVNVEPYSPQLKSISVVNEIGSKTFKKVEYDISVCEPIITPDLSVISKANAKAVSSIGSERKPLELPNIISPTVKKTITLEKLKGDLQCAPHHIPDVEAPKLDVSNFDMPKISRPSLPNTSICAHKAITFTKPQKLNMELPTFVIPKIRVAHYESTKSIKPTLFSISKVANMAKVQIRQPRQLNTDMLMETKANVKIHALPQITKPEFSPISFKMPERKKIDISHNVKINMTVKPFTFSTKETKISLPNIKAVHVPDVSSALKELLPALNKA